jgi:hypothetical protein
MLTDTFIDLCVPYTVRKTEITGIGIRCADYATFLYPQKLALNSPSSARRSMGIVRSLTKATEFLLLLICETYKLSTFKLP